MRESELKDLYEKARRLRMHAMNMIYRAQSGHPGASLSLAEVMAVLYFSILRVDPNDPSCPDRDRLILSKGHGAPILYAALVEKGFIPLEELRMFREVGGLLEGHPSPKIPGVDAASGSLGFGLSMGVGMAKGLKIHGRSARVFVILGDGEQNEGLVWEAAMAASHLKLDNLIAITDHNRFQNDGATSDILDLGSLERKWEAFGWGVVSVDGHNVEELYRVLQEAIGQEDGRPKMVIARTVKGRGVRYLEIDPSTHYAPPSEEQWRSAMVDLQAR